MNTAIYTSTRLQRFGRSATTSHQATALPTGKELRLPPGLASHYDQLTFQISTLGEYRDLVIDVLQTEAPIEQFIKVPASLQHHHCTRGGLLTHTLDVVSIAETLCRTRPHARLRIPLIAGTHSSRWRAAFHRDRGRHSTVMPGSRARLGVTFESYPRCPRSAWNAARLSTRRAAPGG